MYFEQKNPLCKQVYHRVTREKYYGSRTEMKRTLRPSKCGGCYAIFGPEASHTHSVPSQVTPLFPLPELQNGPKGRPKPQNLGALSDMAVHMRCRKWRSQSPFTRKWCAFT